MVSSWHGQLAEYYRARPDFNYQLGLTIVLLFPVRVLQELGVSLLAVFMSRREIGVSSEGIFAGGKVSEEGVSVNPTKLTAIVDWKQPADVLNLALFVGLTGHF